MKGGADEGAAAKKPLPIICMSVYIPRKGEPQGSRHGCTSPGRFSEGGVDVGEQLIPEAQGCPGGGRYRVPQIKLLQAKWV